jgi:hypothetical protein
VKWVLFYKNLKTSTCCNSHGSSCNRYSYKHRICHFSQFIWQCQRIYVVWFTHFLHQISSYQMGTCFIVTMNKFLYLNCTRKFKQNCITTNLSFFANYCTNVFHKHGNTEFMLSLNFILPCVSVLFNHHTRGNTEFMLSLNFILPCVSVLFNHQQTYYINGLSASTDKLSSHNLTLPIQITVLLHKPRPVSIYWLQLFLLAHTDLLNVLCSTQSSANSWLIVLLIHFPFPFEGNLLCGYPKHCQRKYNVQFSFLL